MIPIVEQAALRAAMTSGAAVDVIRLALRADGEGRARVPPVTAIASAALGLVGAA